MSVATYPAQVDTRVNVNISRWLFRGYRLFAGETRYFVRDVGGFLLLISGREKYGPGTRWIVGPQGRVAAEWLGDRVRKADDLSRRAEVLIK